MKKRFWKRLLLVSMMGILCLGSVFADEFIKGNKSAQKVMLNGREVDISAYTINSENYFKLRDIAALLTDTNKAFDVIYNHQRNAVEITTNKKYEKIKGDLAPLQEGEVQGIKSRQIVEVDSQVKDVKAYTINGNNYFRLRDLGKILNFDVDFDIAAKNVLIVSERIAPKPVPKGEIQYIREEKEGGKVVVSKIYPKEIEDEPMRTCYPKAPEGQIVYDILEECYFNDKGEPVDLEGDRVSGVFREVLARRMGVDPFSFDLRRVKGGHAGGEPGNWNQ